MRRGKIPPTIFGLLLCSLLPLSAGDIQGTVVDSSGNAIAGSELVLIHASGQKHQAFTDVHGYFAFASLADGQYDLSLRARPDFIILRPKCGSFSVSLAHNETKTYGFEVDSPGVSVDFGRPAGGGTLNPFTNPSGSGEPFRFAMSIRELRSIQERPDSFELLIHAHTAHPKVYAEMDQVVFAGQGNAQDVDILVSQASNGLLTISFRGTPETLIENNGEILLFRGRLISHSGTWLSDTQNHLCVCVESLTFFQDGHPLDHPGLEKFRDSWSSCFQAASP